ncbi:hypothetical protein Acr_15g0009690 [Actinidia rufa]|uniref:Uncharacterized protein n=1 Tax=Actinidia rufa TaxID=165716 RepID=A0A7J0FUJ7_9ERIC|nr:hypothetical protein Acr_15g0009690 [Actinidia rufa]
MHMYEAAKLLLFLPSLCIDALQCIEKLVHNFKLWIVYYYYEFHNPAVVAKDAVPEKRGFRKTGIEFVKRLVMIFLIRNEIRVRSWAWKSSRALEYPLMRDSSPPYYDVCKGRTHYKEYFPMVMGDEVATGVTDLEENVDKVVVAGPDVVEGDDVLMDCED